MIINSINREVYRLSVRMRIRSFLLTLLPAALIWAAEPSAPDTPSARQFTGYLKAFNSGDRSELKEFFEKNYQERDQSVDDQIGFRACTRGFAARKSQVPAATKVVGLVQGRDSDQF